MKSWNRKSMKGTKGMKNCSGFWKACRDYHRAPGEIQ